jgi:hypothetical protein
MRTNLLLAFLLLVVSFGVGLARKPQQDTGCCGFAARPGSGTSYESTSQGTDGESGGGHLSELNHQVWFRLTAHQLNSAHGYFARVTGETAPGEANAELFDSEGKLISQARIWFPEALRVFLFDVSPLRNGGAVAGGQAETTEGSTSFLGKTDASGSSASVLRLQTFIPGRVCQGSDDTIWVFGRDPEKESANDLTYLLVRQYSFEKGLLSSYLPRESIALRKHAMVGGGGPNGSFLVCGENQISFYLNQTNEYIQINPDTQTLQRWKMDMAPLAQAKVTGFAVTENGRVYASLYELEPASERKTHGLFELRAEPEKEIATWVAVTGTLNSHREGEAVAKGTFWRLWGAEGNDLIIGQQYGAEFSWVRVIH